jgi:hypothetical protein
MEIVQAQREVFDVFLTPRPESQARSFDFNVHGVAAFFVPKASAIGS